MKKGAIGREVLKRSSSNTLISNNSTSNTSTPSPTSAQQLKLSPEFIMEQILTMGFSKVYFLISSYANKYEGTSNRSHISMCK